jgi:prevent-host-death family protein
MTRGVAVVGARELKTRLGRYLNLVRQGQTIIVTDRHEPVAELRPLGNPGDPVAVALGRLAATGSMTLPTSTRLTTFEPVRISRGSASVAVASDRDERG